MAARLAAMGVRGYDQVLMEKRWNGRVVDRTVEALKQLAAIKGPALVFVQSMGDVFHEGISDEQISDIIVQMYVRRDVTFQILTKRPDRALAYVQKITDGKAGLGNALRRVGKANIADVIELAAVMTGPGDGMPPCQLAPNIWMGVTCENQEMADQRLPLLLQIPAAVRFVSIEPMLGPVIVPDVIEAGADGRDGIWFDPLRANNRNAINWMIVGAESGAQRRPGKIEWVRDIVAQCRAAAVPVFVKQLDLPGHKKVVKDVAMFPVDLQIQQWPAGAGRSVGATHASPVRARTEGQKGTDA